MGWQWGQGPWKRFPYIQVSDVLCYKPIPIILRIVLLRRHLQGQTAVRVWTKMKLHLRCQPSSLTPMKESQERKANQIKGEPCFTSASEAAACLLLSKGVPYRVIWFKGTFFPQEKYQGFQVSTKFYYHTFQAKTKKMQLFHWCFSISTS